MADVFISYHMESAGEKSPEKIVPKIAAALKDVGVSCWYAERDLTETGSFADTITKEIRACKVFLLVLNEGSNQSKHVKNELHFAFEHKKLTELVPFKIEDYNISDGIAYYIGRLQITDGNPPDQEHIRQLAKQIADAVQPEPPTWEMVREQQQMVREQQQRIRELENKVQTLTEHLLDFIKESEYSNKKSRELVAQLIAQGREQMRYYDRTKQIINEFQEKQQVNVGFYKSQETLKQRPAQVQTLEEQLRKMGQNLTGEESNEDASLLARLLQQLITGLL